MNTYLTGSESMSTSFDYSLPSTFRIEYEYSETSNQVCSSLLWIGESTSRAVLVGRIGGNDSTYQVWVRTSSDGTGDLKSIGSTIPNTNTYKSFFAEYNGSTFNFNDDISVTNLNGVSPSKLIQVSGYHGQSQGAVGKGMIRNIKIKPV